MPSIPIDVAEVLAQYPEHCRARYVEPLGALGGEHGSEFWRVDSVSGPMLLRRWDQDVLPEERVQFMQAVMWHATQEGFGRLPLPLEAASHAGYIRHAGHIWQLEPFAAGQSDYRDAPSVDRLTAAVMTLAEFHCSVEGFPIAQRPSSVSPAIQDRLRRMQASAGREMALLLHAAAGAAMDLPESVPRILATAPHLMGNVTTLLSRASRQNVALQPCIVDIHERQIFFDEDFVASLVGFGSMAVDNIAIDLAGLLAGLARDDAKLWAIGLVAYQMVRPLTDAERYLVVAFDRSSLLLDAFDLLRRLLRESCTLREREDIAERLDHQADRMDRVIRTLDIGPERLLRSA